MKSNFEQEVLDRVIRIESRVVQLGDHVGANLRTKQRIEIDWAGEYPTVEIDSLDVSLSRIYAQLSQAKRPITGVVHVYHNNKRVMTVYP